MSVFLQRLSLRYYDELILLVVDQASCHKSKDLLVPDNIRLFFLPPRTPEMNPVEILWREIRKRGFKNKCFDSIKSVIAMLHEVVLSLSNEDVRSLTFWGWIRDAASLAYA
jgi:putative transposase